VSLSSDGSTILIGAWGKKIGANIQQGAAYIFGTLATDPAVGSSIVFNSPINIPVTRTLTISNTGSVNLIINGLSITGPGASVFSTNPTITASSPFTVPATVGSNTNSIFITCIPTSMTTFTATLTLTNTDTVPVNYTLICTGASGLVYYPLPKPIRVLDTRIGATALYNGSNGNHSFIAGQTMTYTLANITYGGSTIPAAAQVVVVNLSAILPKGQGYLTIYPSPADVSGANRPLISSMNYRDAAVTSNTSYLTVGTDGIVNVYSLRATDLVLDVSGYYAPAGTVDPNGFSSGLVYYPLPKPIRVLDTRAGATALYNGSNGKSNFAAGETRKYNLAGISYTPSLSDTTQITIPATAKALVANTTAVLPTGNGYLTLYPGPEDVSGANRPLISSMNYKDTDVTISGSYPTLDANGAANIYSLRATHVVLDVSGYFAPIGTVDPNSSSITGLYYNPLSKPIRVLDTRANQRALYNGSTGNTSLTAGSTKNYILAGISYTSSISDTTQITIPATAKAVVATTTAVLPTGNGYLTIYPGPADASGANRPTISSLNYRLAFTTTSNPSHITVSSSGVANVYSTQATDVVMDISGYYIP
jgi:hypothetical protein